jgi:hypothetical protein
MESLDDLFNRAETCAFDLGEKAGRNHANWVEQDTFGGRCTGDQAEAARAVLKAIEDCDDGLYDGLPNLSGEWADSPTPRSILEDVFHYMNVTSEYEQTQLEDILDDLCEQWECGVRSGFESELHRLATNASN